MIATLYPIFRRWSEKGSVYLLSDPHFADSDCKLMDPDWIPPEEQVRIINDLVKKNDTFICLGDVGSREYAAQIKAGHKVLLLGNHDRKKDYKDIFDEIYDGPLFIAEKILLSHEPVYGLSWCLNIHGHDHWGIEEYRDGCRHEPCRQCMRIHAGQPGEDHKGRHPCGYRQHPQADDRPGGGAETTEKPVL